MILELLKNHVPQRKIAIQLRVSTREISKIKKRNDNIEEQNKRHFKISKILHHYNVGKDPFTVFQDFDVDLNDAKDLYVKFLETKNLYLLAETLRKIDKDSLELYLELFDSMNKQGVDNTRLNEIIKIVNESPKISKEYQLNLNKLNDIQGEIKYKNSIRNCLLQKNIDLRTENDTIKIEILRKKELLELEKQRKIKEKKLDLIIEDIRSKEVSLNQIEMSFEKGDTENKIKEIVMKILNKGLDEIIMNKIIKDIMNGKIRFDKTRSDIKKFYENDINNYLKIEEELRIALQSSINCIPEIVWWKVKNDPIYG